MQIDRKYSTTTVKTGQYKNLKQVFCCKDAEKEKAMTFTYDINAHEKREITKKMKKATCSSASVTVTRPWHIIIAFRNMPNV